MGGLIGTAIQVGAQKAMQEDQQRFITEQRSTAYQVATEDMRKAGINPMLAIGQGGAQVAPGSQGSIANPGDLIGSTIDNVRSAKTFAADIKKRTAEADNARAHADIAQNQVPESNIRSMPWRWGERIMDTVGNTAKEGIKRGVQQQFDSPAQYRHGPQYQGPGHVDFNRNSGNPPGLHHRPGGPPGDDNTAKKVLEFMRWLDSF